MHGLLSSSLGSQATSFPSHIVGSWIPRERITLHFLTEKSKVSRRTFAARNMTVAIFGKENVPQSSFLPQITFFPQAEYTQLLPKPFRSFIPYNMKLQTEEIII